MRTQYTLTDGWYVKALTTATPDIETLMYEAAAPDESWLPANMPSQIHEILLAHGQISDPHFGKNAADSVWVGDKDWVYAGNFLSPEPQDGPIFLRFEGLDTLCAAYLNGVLIGNFDNMFREYSVDVSANLNPLGQENLLLLIFSSPSRFVREVVQRPEDVGRISPQNYFRKAVNDFNSYLGARPNAVKVGVYRPIILDLPGRVWFDDVWVRTELAADHTEATVLVQVTLGSSEALSNEVYVGWTLSGPDGQEVGNGTADISGAAIPIRVTNPQLWWPWTYGSPALYRLEVRLVQNSQILDSREVAVGIREVRLVLSDPVTGEKRFQFEINGQPIFLQGANWVPIEGMTHVWDSERAKNLLDLAQHGNMNVLRVWAGGLVPPREFYDECDRRGILIWQDFMFEYGMLPNADPAYAANCKLEVEEHLRRLRSHPCLLLWCGGNENYMWWDITHAGEPVLSQGLFEGMVPDACARLDSDRPYHPNSPHGGPTPNWPLEGDWHDYTWRAYTPETSLPLFISEGGCASSMTLNSLRRFLPEEDVWPTGYDPTVRTPGQPAWPPMWQYRSVEGSWIKVKAVEDFCDPKTPEEMIRVIGTAHGEYLQKTVEHYRRGSLSNALRNERQCGGYMIWRLNDAWPISYYSVLDYTLEPKIAFYYLRRAFAPVLVCFERTQDKLAVWVVNDSPVPAEGVLTVRRRNFDGADRATKEIPITVASGQSLRCLDATDLGAVLLHAEFLQASFAGQDATCLVLSERYLHLPRTDLQVQRVEGGIEVTSDVFARQVTLEIPDVPTAVFGDNFFNLAPGQTRTIPILGSASEAKVLVRAFNADPVTV